MSNNKKDNKKENKIENVISQGSKMQMVVIKTPLKGVKNRKGEQAYSSVTVHRLIPPKKKKDKKAIKKVA